MVKAGYKETDKGVIPSDWSLATLGQIGNPQMCKRVFKEQTHTQGEIPFYKIGTFGKRPDAYISRDLFENYRSRFSYPQKGDILLSAAGTIGRTVVFDGKDAYFQDSNIVWLDNDQQKVLNEYLYYVYAAIKWKTADGGTVSRLYNGLLKNTAIILPPIEEQRAIATALSDVDELIENLEKLIEKKKAIKQGTMQDLLTGKKRLPGFNDEWKEHALSDYAECIRGVSYGGSRDVFLNESDNTIRLLRSNNIQDAQFVNRGIQYVRRSRASEKQLIRQGDIMVCMANGSKSLVGKSCYFGKDMHGLYSFGAFMSVVRLLNIKDGAKYIFYLMNSDIYWKNIALLLSGSSINNLRPGDILGMVFKFPDKDERDAITKVLDDMENEIIDLENKLVKYRQIKHGMMQKLLTGQIRLV